MDKLQINLSMNRNTLIFLSIIVFLLILLFYTIYTKDPLVTINNYQNCTYDYPSYFPYHQIDYIELNRSFPNGYFYYSNIVPVVKS